jgi:hypothetical protein
LLIVAAAVGADADAVGEVLAEAIPVGEDDVAADADVEADADADAVGVVAAVVLLELLDEQAVSAAAAARPNTGTTRSRRFV